MKHLQLTLLVILFLSGCRSSELPDSPIDYFESITPVTGEIIFSLDKQEIYRPTSIIVRDSVLFVHTNMVNVVFRTDLRTNTKSVLFRRGNGPKEILAVTYPSISNGYGVFAECNKRFLVEYPLKTEYQPEEVHYSYDLPIEYGNYTGVIRGKDCLIFIGLFDRGRYMYYNLNNNKVNFYGDYRVKKKYENLSQHGKKLIYISSRIAIKPDLSHFVCINFNNGVIDINAIRGDSIANTKKLDFHYQDVIIVGNNKKDMRTKNTRTNRNGFYDVATNDDYIFTIYSGKSVESAGLELSNCDYLMVFDWKGNPVACFRTDNPLRSVCCEGNTVYGLDAIDQSTIYKFDLDLD